MTDRMLSTNLQRAARRLMRLRLWTGFGLIWLAFAAVGLLLLWGPVDISGEVRNWAMGLASCAALVSIGWAVFVSRRSRDLRSIARRIELKFPALNASLLTALEQQPDDRGGFSFLQRETLGRAREHSRTNDWRSVVPAWRLLLAGLTNVVGLTAAAIVFAAIVRLEPARASSPAAAKLDNPTAAIMPDYRVEIEPGDVAIEKGTSLLVLARFPVDVPESAVLLWRGSDDNAGSVAMTRSLEDPVFAGRIGVVTEPMTYSVDFADTVSDSYQVTVFEYPRLEQADATLRYPAYTELEDRVVQDVRRITALRGTDLSLEFRLNKPVAMAQLISENDEAIDLTVDPVDSVCRVQMPLTESGVYRLQLVDADNRANKQPPRFVFKVTDNAEPKLKMVQPKQDVQVSPLEELDLHATVWDDFGVAQTGLSYSIAGGEGGDVILGEKLAGRTKTDLLHKIALEELKAEPDQLLSFYFWAEDTGPDGKPRRTMGDMFFAEVRPFEEIFRQGQPPPGGEPQEPSESAQKAEELAELQKQIISAAWKVIRRETRDEVTAEFIDDAALLVESQQAAIAQLEELAAELNDAQSQKFAADAADAMQTAAVEFESARAQASAEPLKPALSAAQLAYQGLLKLRAREHQVVRAQQKPGQGRSSQSRSQQQMNELELDDEENRYETQSTAQQQQESAEEREDRQVLNRLRELARRQDDLNERIKESQSALEQAETEAEREEIERKLKRLREEQQQILRDADELGQRMDQAQNQERMGEEREQLDQARENARQASEALKEGQVSQAAAEGTRAEEQFREMKEEFQKRTSNALAEQVRELQDRAEDVVKNEQKLAEALRGEQQAEEPGKPSLRTADRDDDLAPQFEKQRERIDNLTERMRETIEEAEAADQGLLAEKLYESIRSTRQRSPQEALVRSELSLRRGLIDDAQKLEEIADESLNELRDGIREAAESVLGDETEALRRARNELQRLSNELSGEIARNSPESSQPNPDAQPNGDGRMPRQNESENGSPAEGQSPEDGEPNSNAGEGDAQEGERPIDEQPAENQGDGPQNGQPSDASQQGQQPSAGEPQNQPSGQGGPMPQEDGEPPQSAGQGGQQPGDNPTGQQPTSQQSQQPSTAPGSGGSTQRERQSLRPDPNSRPNGQQQSTGGEQPGGQRQTRQANSERGGQNAGGAALPNGDERSGQPMDRISQNAAPLTGDDYLDWSDRLRDVEELLTDPKLRAAAAGIRDRAKEVRREVRRQSAEPNWDLVNDMIADPLADLERQVNAELLRRTSDELVPLDRKPIPTEYESAVREYYKRLGAGR